MIYPSKKATVILILLCVMSTQLSYAYDQVVPSLQEETGKNQACNRLQYGCIMGVPFTGMSIKLDKKGGPYQGLRTKISSILFSIYASSFFESSS